MFAALYSPSTPVAVLAGVARAFTPRFEQIGPLVLLDASGLSRLFGTAQELGEHLRAALTKMPGSFFAVTPKNEPGVMSPRIALASTQTAATLLALGRPGLTVVEPGKEARALAPLSLSVLDRFEKLDALQAPQAPEAPSSGGWHHPRNTHQASRGRRRVEENRQLEILTKWGIRTLGALAVLPGPEVFERLGARGVQWQALARGEDTRPMVPWVDEMPFEAALELEWPIEGLEPLSFVLARLLEPLAERLERADRGAAAIETSLRLTTKVIVTRTLQLPAPMRDPKTLRTLILLDLETHPPDAPIDTVRLVLAPTPGRVLQWTLLERAQPAPEQVSTLIARLTALMGERHVGSPALMDTWKPGAFEMNEFRVQSAECRVCPGTPAVPDSLLTLHSALCTLHFALRRFRMPIPTRVQMQDGRPIRVITDRQGFTSGAIVQAAGPWRTSGEWWNEVGPVGLMGQVGLVGKSHRPNPPHPPYQSQPWDRDEWDVSMVDGTIYRLVVERGVGQWFLEGVVD